MGKMSKQRMGLFTNVLQGTVDLTYRNMSLSSDFICIISPLAYASCQHGGLGGVTCISFVDILGLCLVFMFRNK